MTAIPSWQPWMTIVVYVLLPWALWIVFWLCCVNWQKAWPVLARGGWAPVVLLMFIATEVWSRLNPGQVWWQLGTVCALAAVALICGWLQTLTGWVPPEIAVEPAPHAHGHGHGHGHDHHGGHH